MVIATVLCVCLSVTNLQAQNEAKIGTVEYPTLEEAIAAATSGDVVEIIVANCGIDKTTAIPAGVTIKGQGKTATTMLIESTDGSGLTLNNANVTLKDMTIDGSQITSGGYKTLVNVRADGCLITDVVMTGGGSSTWNSSILVETLNATKTFTVSNSTISGSFRGVLRESCNANIVINNCDIDAVYPFNIDGGSGGTVTVTGGALHGWTSYSGVDEVTFTNVTFSKANSGYDIVAAYVNTTFDNCTMDNKFEIYAQTSNFEFVVNNCTKDGTLITNENFTDLFSDSDVWNNCLTTVNEVVLVSKQSQMTEALATATIEANTRMTKSFEFNGVLCGPAADKTLNHNCDDYTFTMKNNGTRVASLSQANGKYTLAYGCDDGSSVNITNASVAISEGTAFTVPAQTDFFTAATGYYLVETANSDGTYTYSAETLADKVALNVNTSTYYTSLQTAVDEVNTDDTVRLLKNITLTSMVTIYSNTNNFTLDLNGDTISFSGTGTSDAAIRIFSGAELTIKDNGNTGAIINPGKGSAVLGGYGTLVLKSGTLEGKGSSTNALYLWATGASTMGSAIINGGTLKSTSGMAIRHRGDMLTINDGTFISGNNNVIQNQSNAEINGGTFTPGTASRYAIYNTGTMTINDATTNGTGGSLSNSGTMTVNDGVFSSLGGNAAYNSSAGVLTINDGEFHVSASNGFRNIPQSGNTPEFYFNGGTVTDHGVTQSVIYNTGKFVMTGVELSASAADYTVWIDGNGIFETHNGKIENTKTGQSALIYCDDGDAQITIDGTQLIGTANNTYGIWEVGPNVNITMTSGSINTTKYCIVNNGTYTTTTSKWVIEGGTLTSTESTAIYHAAPDSLIVGIDCDHGPVITGVNAAIEHRAGHMVIKGGSFTATATSYSVTPNASGITTTGAAVAVAQHTTNVETTLDITCGTFEGESSISIANPQGNTDQNVDASITGGTFTGEVVTSDTRIEDYITGGTYDDATVIGELTSRIEPGYYPFDNGNNTVIVGRYSVVYHDNSTDDLQYAVMLPQNEDFPTTITITMPTTFTPVAGSVVAWNTKADGTGDWYTEGSTVEISSYLDLYAH